MLWVLSKRDRRFADAVDSRTAQLFGFWFLLCVVLTWRGLWRVANIAHGVGAVLGALVGLAMAAKHANRRVAAAAGVVVILAASLAGASVFRGRLNLTRDNHRSLVAGYQAAQEGRFDEAIRHYGKALEIDPKSSVAWYNLGYTYDASGRIEEAVTPFRKAFEIEPHDSRHRSALLSTATRAAEKARERGDHPRAVELLKIALEVDPSNSYVWLDLAFAYDALGKAGEAAEAREKARSLAPR
jgi:tetratricopeptide (TPR) repeat protein